MFNNTVFPGGERKQGKVEEVKQAQQGQRRQFKQSLQCQAGLDPLSLSANKGSLSLQNRCKGVMCSSWHLEQSRSFHIENGQKDQAEVSKTRQQGLGEG
jgi:hypothetical protein